MNLGFTVRILKEDGTFIAHVPELDVASCGATEADARRNIADAVQGFLETAKEQGRSAISSRGPAIVWRTAAGTSPSLWASST